MNKIEYLKTAIRMGLHTDESENYEMEFGIVNMNSCPQLLPNVYINTSRLEDGFKDKFVQLPEQTDMYTCAICSKLPRMAVSLPCKHIMCTHHSMDAWRIRQSRGKCGICKQEFKRGQLSTCNEFSMDKALEKSKLKYLQIKVTCPECRSFVGTPISVDEHQHYLCPMRRVKCPCDGCDVEMTADLLDCHYKVCGSRRSMHNFTLLFLVLFKPVKTFSCFV